MRLGRDVWTIKTPLPSRYNAGFLPHPFFHLQVAVGRQHPSLLSVCTLTQAESLECTVTLSYQNQCLNQVCAPGDLPVTTSPQNLCLHLAKGHFYCRNDKISSHINRGVSVRTLVRAITKSVSVQTQVPAIAYMRTALPLAFRDTHSWE